MQPWDAARAERADVGGAVDAGAVVDAHPARLERVVGPRRDHLAGQLARPGAVRARARTGSRPCSARGRGRPESRARPARPRSCRSWPACRFLKKRSLKSGLSTVTTYAVLAGEVLGRDLRLHDPDPAPDEPAGRPLRWRLESSPAARRDRSLRPVCDGTAGRLAVANSTLASRGLRLTERATRLTKLRTASCE